MSATLLPHQSQRDRLATPIALVVTVVHCLAGLLVFAWYYFFIPRAKRDFDNFGIELSSQVVVLIKLSDVVVNYWYILFALAVPAAVLDFVVVRWICKVSGIGWGIALGVWIAGILLINVAVMYYILDQAR